MAVRLQGRVNGRLERLDIVWQVEAKDARAVAPGRCKLGQSKDLPP